MKSTLVLGALAVSLALVSGGCLLFDIPPAREPLDHFWTRAMLAGRYGRWEDGREVAWPASLPNRDTIESYPEGALHTKYRIRVTGQTSPEGAAWDLTGGLVGRVDADGTTIELFGKETVRVHAAPRYGSVEGRDYTYEFFLVVRPASTGQGRLVRRWRFPPGELALTGSSIDPALFQRSTRLHEQIENIVRPPRGARPYHFVDGYLDFDPSARVAIVTVTGLKRPFQDRVDLSRELRP